MRKFLPFAALALSVPAEGATFVLISRVVAGVDATCSTRFSCQQKYLQQDKVGYSLTLSGEGQAAQFGFSIFTDVNGETFAVEFFDSQVRQVRYFRTNGDQVSSLYYGYYWGGTFEALYAYDHQGRFPASYSERFAVITSITLDGQPVAVFVPEPSTWAMLMIGFGAVGGAMRGSRRLKTRRVRFAA